MGLGAKQAIDLILNLYLLLTRRHCWRDFVNAGLFSFILCDINAVRAFLFENPWRLGSSPRNALCVFESCTCVICDISFCRVYLMNMNQ